MTAHAGRRPISARQAGNGISITVHPSAWPRTRLLLALSIWFAPFVGWFLFVSAYTKRSPFLFAFLPLIVVPMIERIIIGTTAFIDMLVSRAPFMVPIFEDMGGNEFVFDDEERLMDMAREGISLWSVIDIGGFVTSGSVWLGLIVCALFSTAAIYVRRYRDDS